jgi:protein gp37
VKNSTIAWTDHTWNPWWGCTKVSPGCTNCYADAFAKRTGHPVWGKDAPRRFFGEKHWREPFLWNEAAKAEGVRRRVFCASMADVFEDYQGPDAERLIVERTRLWLMIEGTPNLDWLLLTKRPERYDRMPRSWMNQVPDNVWRGTTVESPDYLHRVEALLDGPGGVTFVSYEPALAPVSFGRWLAPRIVSQCTTFRKLSWIIGGGESGPNRRPCEPEWFVEVARECDAFNTPFFMKQDGGLYPGKQGRIDDATWAHKDFPS